MQVEETHECFSNKIIYEEIRAILQYILVYKVILSNQPKYFAQKIKFLKGSFKTMCEQ